MRKPVTLTPYEGGSIWTDEAERLRWYANMEALEAAFAKAGIPATAITAEMAVRWRATGIASKGKDIGAKARAVKASKRATALPGCPTCDSTGPSRVERRKAK